tara:strand:+ start:527 stop:1549 length:1023 start_codon:yes stop_codon:yes gene_type:complete
MKRDITKKRKRNKKTRKGKKIKSKSGANTNNSSSKRIRKMKRSTVNKDDSKSSQSGIYPLTVNGEKYSDISKDLFKIKNTIVIHIDNSKEIAFEPNILLSYSKNIQISGEESNWFTSLSGGEYFFKTKCKSNKNNEKLYLGVPSTHVIIPILFKNYNDGFVIADGSWLAEHNVNHNQETLPGGLVAKIGGESWNYTQLYPKPNEKENAFVLLQGRADPCVINLDVDDEIKVKKGGWLARETTTSYDSEVTNWRAHGQDWFMIIIKGPGIVILNGSNAFVNVDSSTGSRVRSAVNNVANPVTTPNQGGVVQDVQNAAGTLVGNIARDAVRHVAPTWARNII